MNVRTELPIELVVMSGPYDGQRYVLRMPHDPARGYVLGRRHDCDWVFNYDDQLSGKHARVFMANDGWYVEDLKSTNKTHLGRMRADHTFIGRELIPAEQPQPITDGQLIQLGRLWLRVHFSAIDVDQS
jgi:predicted component of type VI protein secretion system